MYIYVLEDLRLYKHITLMTKNKNVKNKNRNVKAKPRKNGESSRLTNKIFCKYCTPNQYYKSENKNFANGCVLLFLNQYLANL